MNDPIYRLTSKGTRLCFTLVALALALSIFRPSVLAQPSDIPGKPATASHVAPIASQLAFEAAPVQSNAAKSDEARSSELFSAQGHGYRVALRPQAAVVSFPGSAERTDSQLSLSLLGSNPAATVTPQSPLPGVSNYIPSSDPKTWRMGVERWSRVNYAQVYSGIDLSFYGNQQLLEYDYRVAPQANPSQIRMRLDGVQNASLDMDGNLAFEIDGNNARLLKPVSYQTSSSGERIAVSSDYRLTAIAGGGWQLGFSLGAYDSTRELIIDPVLSYGLQPAYVDYTVSGITVDAAGNTYTTGQNQAKGFYVSKYTATGTLVFNTIVGSATVTAYPAGISIDSTGKIYIVATAPPGLPTTANAFQTVSPSTKTYYTVPYVAVLPAAGTAPTYASYLGGTNNYDYASGIHLDSSNNIYITGYESSTTFPTTSSAYLKSYPGGSYAAFVAKINPTASGAASLVYSTLLGASTITSVGSAIAVDAAGDAYVAVQSYAGYPHTTGAYNYNGFISDAYYLGAYVTKVNPAGSALLYSAYIGPGAITGIAVDTNLDAYVTGTVSADDFPTTSGAYQTLYPGGFVSELNPAGSALVYSTFLSGPSGAYSPSSNTVFPQSIAITPGCASVCAAYVSGYTTASDFPAVNAIEAAPPLNLSPNAFVTELAGNGASSLFSTYLTGMTGTVTSPFSTPLFPTPAAAVDGSGNVYLAANFYSYGDLPITLPAAAQIPYSYLAKISPAAGGLIVPYPKTLNFDNIDSSQEAVGVSSTLSGNPVPVVLRNLGSSPVAISSITFSPATEFSETDSCALSIPAGGTCTLNMAFTPAAKGVRTATMSIASNAAVNTVTVPVSGTAQALGYLQVSSSTLTFPAANLGATSSTQTITVTNIGKTLVNLQPFSLSSIRSTWGTGTDFQVLSNCPAQVQPAASCSIGVTFTPLASGTRAAQFFLQGDGYGNQYISLYGSGISGTQGTISLSATVLNFNAQLINTLSPRQTVVLTSTGAAPVSVYGVTIATAGHTASDFSIYSGSCVSTTSVVSIAPQSSCTVVVAYTPTVAGAETGTLTFTDSATGTPHAVSLTGSGLAATQSLEFTPGNFVYPDQPVGVPSAANYFYAFNTGTAPVTIDRVLVTGDYSVTSSNCPGTILKPNPAPGYEPSPSCNVRITFTPAATGTRTGTLTFVDTAGNPQVLTLSGNGIAATGGILLEPSALVYAMQAVGTTSPAQRLTIVNAGNSAVNLTNIVTTGDYAVVDSCTAGTFPYVLGAGRTCYADISFTPTKVATADAGTVVVSSSAGAATQTLTGPSLAAVNAIGLTPTAINLGTVVTASQSSAYYLWVRNTGTEAITLTSGTVTGANAADFTFSSGNCGFYANLLAPGASCYTQVFLTPSAAGARSATLTLVDSAGTQTVALTGTGAASLTGIQASPAGLAFDQVPVGSSSASPLYGYLYNHGATSLTVSTAKISAGGSAFLIPVGSDGCTGKTIAANNSCYVQVQFSPTAAGYQTGTLTFTDSTNKTYPITLAGYSPAVTASSYLDHTAIAFPGQVLTTFSTTQTVSLNNTSDIPLTVGTLTGTNTIVGATTSGVFSTSSTQGGGDGCSGQIVAPRAKCTVYIVFGPTAAGSATGTLVFPVKYANNATASFSLALTGTGIAVKDAAELSPSALTFQDQAITAQYGNGADSTQVINLWNSGNLPFTVGALTGTDTVIGTSTTGDFTVASAFGGYDGCTSQTISPNAYCSVTVAFNPAAVGAKAGTIKFPVTYNDKTTTSLTASLAGKGIAAGSKVVVSPSTGQFDVQVIGTTSDSSETLTFTMSNTGNLPVKVTTATITTPFSFVGDYCSGTTIAVNSSCQITVAFSPTTAAPVTGTLTIPNSAAGSPQIVHLSGTGILATKQIVLSQTGIAFGNQVVSTKSAPVTVLVSNQSGATVPVSSVVLGGANKTDFTIVDGCSGQSIYGHSNCAITATFTPAATSTGARTATITETDTATGGPRVITLTGTGTAATPSAALYPASLSFGNQALSTRSTPLTFSVTNTGSSALNITSVVSSNATEFPITTNGCSGKSIAAGANCLVAITFAPNAGSTQTATITVTDNASPTTQTLTATGVSVGTPKASLAPATLAFGNEGVGVVSAAKTITLTDSGTDTLHIASIAFAGTNASDFKQTNTCGTSIVAGASCVISVTFNPAALGARTATLNVTDDAGNVTGTVQSATLTGTGTGVAKIAFSPTSLAFSSTNVGVASAVKTITVSNPGTAALPITSVSITPAGDYTQTNTCGTSLAISATCVISVTFKPTVAGTRTASISVADGAAASPQTVALTGTAVGVPAATLSATTVAFGNQAVAVASAAHTVTLTNSGTGPLVVSAVKLSGTNATDFTETSTTCPGTLAPAAACTLSVVFKPAASGARTATMTITDNAGNVASSTQTVALTGTGSGTPQAKLSATTLAMPSTAVGSSSGPMGVTLQNAGNGPLTIASIKISGADPRDFLEFDTCQPSLAAATTCEVELYFLPTATGARTANVVITDNANNVANATQTIAVTGTATGAPQVSLSTATTAFGTVKTGTQSNGLSITLTNTGNATLTVASVALGGTDPADYSVFNTCSSVTEGSSCIAVVFFKPAAVGSRPATLTFTDNANNIAGAKQVVTITGTGN